MSVSDRILQYRRWIIIAFHAGMIVFGYWLAYLLRFEFPLSSEDQQQFVRTVPLILVVRLSIFAWYQLYEGLWRYVSMRDILAILQAVSLSSVLFALTVLAFVDPNFPWPIFPIDWGVCLLFVGGARLTLRALWEARARDRMGGERRALIVGAGDAGEMLVREIERNPGLNFKIVGFVDDDRLKQGGRLHGIKVLGGIDQLPDLCRARRVEELLIAIPSATGVEMRRIIGACRAAKVQFSTIPSLGELKEGHSTLSTVRRVNIEDLLRREPVRIERAEVERFVRGKRVLVTGAGGSIGSELCRQVARFGPAALILLDRSENGLFFVEMELRDRFPELTLHAVIGDVTGEGRMAAVFDEHQPQVVFHAAAHKHVPLMEANKAEAVKNNVLGILVVARAAERTGVEDFVMVSTDKAVRPTSVMGATKRLAEMYVQALNARSETRFMTVRFGNVLDSEGSVLQVFQRQIESGGPVTVTHPDMQRYFMTIPEASQLVLQAATQGKGGEIFVLDMGDPVRIVDLAKDLIALSGLDPERDIEIKFTGIRPGEKLFEELLNSETRVLPTSHEKIMVVEADPVDLERLETELLDLLRHAEMEDERSLVAKLAALVPGYTNGQGPAARRPKRTERILVVESDPYTRRTLKRILQTWYIVLEAETEREAMRHVQGSDPHLVMLNFHLPRTNVRRLCEKIRLRGTSAASESPQQGPPILLLVDSAESLSMAQVHELGANDRIYKPLPVSIVEKRVRSLLAQTSVHAETGSGAADD